MDIELGIQKHFHCMLILLDYPHVCLFKLLLSIFANHYLALWKSLEFDILDYMLLHPFALYYKFIYSFTLLYAFIYPLTLGFGSIVP